MADSTIVTCFPISADQVQQIRRVAGADFEVVVSSQEEIGRLIFDADIFCGHAKVPVDWPAVVQQGRLRWIQSSAAGLDHCLVPAVIDSEILVSGCSGLFAPQVAEQTLALLFGLLRGLPQFFHAQQNREYVRLPTDDFLGKRVGILGLGGNGQRIARALRPLTDHIIGTDLFEEHCRSLTQQKIIDQLFPANQTADVLAESDVVIITLPLTDHNEQLLDDKMLKMMPPKSYLINVGRGSVVDTGSLIRQLESGHLAGAGLDVVDPEPLPQISQLWKFPNVIITPHVGAQSALRVPVTVDLFCENLNRYRTGQHLLNWVDKHLGFPQPKHRIKF